MLPTAREDVKIVSLRPEDIPAVVASGAVDLGITGFDLVVESGADVTVLEDLGVGRARIVVAVPEWVEASSPGDLPDGVRVATKYARIAEGYFKSLGVRAEVVKVSGSTEVLPLLGAADAVIDVASTGATLRIHGLRIIDTIMETSARLISSPMLDDNSLVEEVVESIRSVVRARRIRLILMNVPDARLGEVLSVVPSMGGPTVARVESTSEPMWEVIIAVDSDLVGKAIIDAKRGGARDIVVLDVDRVIP